MQSANGENGRAVDVPPLMQVVDWIHDAFPNSRELIFTPSAGGRSTTANCTCRSGCPLSPTAPAARLRALQDREDALNRAYRARQTQVGVRPSLCAPRSAPASVGVERLLAVMRLFDAGFFPWKQSGVLVECVVGKVVLEPGVPELIDAASLSKYTAAVGVGNEALSRPRKATG